jgi:conjugative relaxase-like TrwC/TraI family protein
MLVVSKASNSRYYTTVSRDEALSDQVEGYWLGSGSEILALPGNVKQRHFNNLIDGYHPKSKQKKLVSNAGHSKRQGGWDLVFLPPKSVSVVLSQLPKPSSEKKIILEEHHKAVEKALDVMSSYILTRRYDNNVFWSEKANLIIAGFTHYVSRQLDPLLHTHAIVINLCFREDGSTGSIQSRQMYVLQKQIGTLYRAEFAKCLEERLGLSIVRHDGSFEIAGIPERVIQYFSKRRAEIMAHVELLGFDSPGTRKIANFETRSEKIHRNREALFLDWREQGQALGLADQYIKTLFEHEIRRDQMEQIQTVVSEVSKRLQELNRPFFDRDVLLLVAEESQGRGIGIDLAQSIYRGYLASDDVTLIKEFQKSNQYEHSSCLIDHTNAIHLEQSLQDEEEKRDNTDTPVLQIVRGV